MTMTRSQTEPQRAWGRATSQGQATKIYRRSNLGEPNWLHGGEASPLAYFGLFGGHMIPAAFNAALFFDSMRS
jgi:hypothetical protein